MGGVVKGSGEKLFNTAHSVVQKRGTHAAKLNTWVGKSSMLVGSGKGAKRKTL
jgi:hypothetical protein